MFSYTPSFGYMPKEASNKITPISEKGDEDLELSFHVLFLNIAASSDKA
jgi:hypothetical protein